MILGFPRDPPFNLASFFIWHLIVNTKVEYSRSYYSGFPSNVIPLLRISVSLFLRYYRRVKIGITGNPERRWRQHRNHNKGTWDRMVVKYVTTSVHNANLIEKFFIEAEPALKNRWTGWSNMSEAEYYYVYILLGGRRRK